MDYWKRLFFTLAFLLPVALPGMSAATRDVKLLGLTCNYVEEPIGMGDKKPLLGWRIDTDRAGYLQGSYRVLSLRTRRCWTRIAAIYGTRGLLRMEKASM